MSDNEKRSTKSLTQGLRLRLFFDEASDGMNTTLEAQLTQELDSAISDRVLIRVRDSLRAVNFQTTSLLNCVVWRKIREPT